MRNWTVTGAAAGLGGLVLLLAACGGPNSTNAGSAYGGPSLPATPASSPTSGTGAASGMGATTATLTIKTTTIGKVLTDARGDTLYTYAKDTKGGPSTCTGSCLAEWPRVLGKAVAASGVKLAGKLGSVTDPGGTIQATYDGYPLYTYAGDMAPGQITGNGAGAVWHVITGTILTAAMPAGAMSSPAATQSSSGASGSSGASSGYGAGYGAGTNVSSSSPKPPASMSPTAPAASPSTPATPAPVPTPSVNGGGCGEGACW